MIGKQESLAIDIIFRENNEISNEIRKQIKSAQTIDFEITGPGFYATINFARKLTKIPNFKIWTVSFEHPSFLNGGTYNCTFLDENQIEIEGVTFGGQNWPNPENKNKFENLIGPV